MTENPQSLFTIKPAQLDILQKEPEAIVPAFESRLVYKMVAEKMNRVGLVFDPHAVDASLKKIRKASSSMRNKLDQLYDVDIFLYDDGKETNDRSKKQKELTTELIKSRLAHAFDPGLSRNVDFYLNPDEGDLQKQMIIKENGSYILRRSTFISDINKKIAISAKKSGQIPTPNFSFIDIANVRKADKEVAVGNKAGDLLVNRASKIIENAVVKFCETNGRDKSNYPAIGRYGGDEFIIGWIPPLTAQERIRFGQIVMDALSPELTDGDTPATAYFGATDRNEYAKVIYSKGNIKMKNNKIDWIETPTSNNEQYIFEDYFQRGLILTKEELGIVMQKKEYQDGSVFSLDKYNEYQKAMKRPAALDVLKNVEEKVDFLSKRHKNFAMPLYLSQYWDEVESRESGIKTIKRQEAMVEYVKDIVYDKLLGYGVVSKLDFQEQVENGDIDYSISIDLKFIKEMNELVGYAEADESIASLWHAINRSLEPADRARCTFARAGGTFYIGINKGETLSENAFNKLKSLKAFDLDISSTGKGTSITVPLGNSLTDESYPSVGQKNDVNEVMNTCEDDFFFNVLEDIKEDPDLLDVIKRGVDPFKQGNHVEYGELLWRFFRLKRYDERVIKLIDQFTKYDPTHPLRTTVIQLYGVLSGLDLEENIESLYARLPN